MNQILVFNSSIKQFQQLFAGIAGLDDPSFDGKINLTWISLWDTRRHLNRSKLNRGPEKLARLRREIINEK